MTLAMKRKNLESTSPKKSVFSSRKKSTAEPKLLQKKLTSATTGGDNSDTTFVSPRTNRQEQVCSPSDTESSSSDDNDQNFPPPNKKPIVLAPKSGSRRLVEENNAFFIGARKNNSKSISTFTTGGKTNKEIFTQKADIGTGKSDFTTESKNVVVGKVNNPEISNFIRNNGQGDGSSPVERRPFIKKGKKDRDGPNFLVSSNRATAHGDGNQLKRKNFHATSPFIIQRSFPTVER